MKISKIEAGNIHTHLFFCPGCNCGHAINTEPGKKNTLGGNVPVWTFNGDFEKPTIRASVLVTSTRDITEEEHTRIMNGEKLHIPKTICHSFVTDGKIQFLDDCTHELKGQTVELPEI